MAGLAETDGGDVEHFGVECIADTHAVGSIAGLSFVLEEDAVVHGLRLADIVCFAHALRTYHLVGIPRGHHVGDGSLAVDDVHLSVSGEILLDGKEIHINRTGLLTPVDAVLKYANGRNVLTLNLNLAFLEEEEGLPNVGKLHKAVIRGIRSWAGSYTVFGGQRLRVDISVTTEPRWFDNVYVIICSGSIAKTMDGVWGSIPLRSARENRNLLLRDHRAMAGVGFGKWSVRSRKFILLQTSNGRFDDYREITDIIRHEFGHVLGLGDLYAEPERDMPGVPAGTYPELDAYVADGRAYNLVMCNSSGKITDNDMEMVVLAFSKNRPQSYQPCRYAAVVSEALGKGN